MGPILKGKNLLRQKEILSFKSTPLLEGFHRPGHQTVEVTKVAPSFKNEKKKKKKKNMAERIHKDVPAHFKNPFSVNLPI